MVLLKLATDWPRISKLSRTHNRYRPIIFLSNPFSVDCTVLSSVVTFIHVLQHDKAIAFIETANTMSLLNRIRCQHLICAFWLCASTTGNVEAYIPRGVATKNKAIIGRASRGSVSGEFSITMMTKLHKDTAGGVGGTAVTSDHIFNESIRLSCYESSLISPLSIRLYAWDRRRR